VSRTRCKGPRPERHRLWADRVPTSPKDFRVRDPLSQVMATAGTRPRHFVSTRPVGAARRSIVVNPRELQGKYARLSAELASLEGPGGHSKARQVRLELELDRVRQQLVALSRVAQTAPTLRDVVMTADPSRDHEGPLYRG
jgi:hypothetical protein